MKGDAFTEAEYLTDPKRVVEYATQHGRAVVVRPDGSVRVVISIPPGDAQKIELDRLLYGTGVGRRRPDGTLEHVPLADLVFEFRRPSETYVEPPAPRPSVLARLWRFLARRGP